MAQFASVIHVVADLLRALAMKEAETLAAYHLDHPPTIGAMYEGLTAKVLNAALPESLDLHVVSGFVTAGTANMSREIDCMVVRGAGEVVPYTSKYKWPVEDVLAVIEVKKTLYSEGLADAYENLRDVIRVYGAHIRDPDRVGEPQDVTPVYNAFRTITGLDLANWEDVQELPSPLQLVFNTLVSEFVSPVRVMFGYEGFASEKNFRAAFSKFTHEHQGERGYGLLGMPQLCVSNGYSLFKLNGQPISAPLEDGGWWPILASATSNPLRFLLALLWSRIENVFGHTMPWDSIDLSALTPFLRVRAVEVDGRIGWNFNEHRM